LAIEAAPSLAAIPFLAVAGRASDTSGIHLAAALWWLVVVETLTPVHGAIHLMAAAVRTFIKDLTERFRLVVVEEAVSQALMEIRSPVVKEATRLSVPMATSMQAAPRAHRS
jgi:hypothetical protein